jgi:hypothetical protein
MFAGQAIDATSPRQLDRSARQFADALPDPRDKTEDLVLRGLLMSVAVEWSDGVTNPPA